MTKNGNIEKLIELASSQWGMFTSAQAVSIGVSRTQIERMSSDGRIEPVSYGVYQLTAGEETSHSRTKAAWLSLFPKMLAYDRLKSKPRDAIVSGQTAACIHGDTQFYESPYSFDVASPKRTARKDVVLRPWPVDECDVAIIEGLPVTNVERTIYDLMRGHEDPSLVGNFIAGVCQKGHILDEVRLATLLAPLAKRYGFASNDGASFAKKLAKDYAEDAQIHFAANSVARALASSPTDKSKKDRLQKITAQAKTMTNPKRVN